MKKVNKFYSFILVYNFHISVFMCRMAKIKYQKWLLSIK